MRTPWSAPRDRVRWRLPTSSTSGVNWGAGPRGVLTLVTCAKARAILYGRYHATVGDVQAVAKGALRHRIAPNYAAQAADVNSEKLIGMLMEKTPADKKYVQPA